MFKIHLKIFVFLIAVMFFAASVLVAAYLVRHEWLPEKVAIEEIEEIREQPVEAPDPGRKDFGDALGYIRDGDLDTGRVLLRRLMMTYHDSSAIPEAKRLVGEINMDQLLSRRPMSGKLDYEVKRGDALAAIVRRNRTTMEYVRLVNSIEGTTIHPGDRLVLFPLEFGLEIDLGARTLTLLWKGDFFKEYPVSEYALPPDLRLPRTLKVGGRSAWVGGERVSAGASGFDTSQKWIQCSLSDGRAGLVISGDGAGETEKKRIPYRILMADSDIEELYVVLREGALVTLKK